ncbi:MAG TPA: hypothetical protein VGN72_07215 [Tepidisphaeraceae bacterium]|jgi:hypothetical protein|nr:hypothetical protein [Tepidisphaeraceae bacterium]
MSKSFFTGTEAELAIGSRAFAEKISASWAEYGLPEAAAAAYVAADAEWQAAYQATSNRNNRTVAEVTTKNSAEKFVRQMASALAKVIAGNAAVSDSTRIKLGLSVRDAASPLPPPGIPVRFTFVLNGIGTGLLKWACDNPRGARGTMYEVWRSGGFGTERVFLGVVGTKRFHDTTLPAGVASVTYHVRAVRSRKAGDWVQHNVSFGVTPGMAKLIAAQTRTIAA